MKTISAFRQIGGFTVTDLLVVLGAVLLLGSWGYYHAGIRKVRSDCGTRTQCLSNLKQTSLAFRMWADDHQGLFPWQVSVTNGGTLEHITSPEVFRQFQAISNELVSPKIVACRADTNRQRGISFETNFSNVNVSYFVALDADETLPMTILFGDRNITTNDVALKGPLAILPANSCAGWTKEIHDYGGNIALADGSVMPTNAKELQRQVGLASNAVVRLAIP